MLHALGEIGYLPLSSAPNAIPLKNMTTPSMAICTERGTIAVATEMKIIVQVE